MKSYIKPFAALAAAVVVGSVFPSAANAEYLVTPVHATCQSFYAGSNTDRRDALATIDSSSMTPPVATSSSHSTVNEFGMWLSSGTKETWIAFDLGCEMTISGMHVWNYNEARVGNNDYFKRGVKTCVVRTGTTMPEDGMSYSDAGSWGAVAEAITLQCASGSETYTGEDVMFTTPVTTRYVMLYVTDNYGNGNYTGLSEVRFYSNTKRAAYMTGESSSAVFPVSTGDLLQTAVASVDDSELVINTRINDGYSKGKLASLTNGTFGAAGHADGLCISHGYVTYNLDTNAVPAGYSIGEVAVYTGWGGSGNGREHSSFSVLYRLVNEVEFRHAGTARYKCTITSTSANRDTCVRMKGLDLTGVAALRFDFGPDEKSQYWDGEIYKEIDVFGALGRPISPVAATAQSNYGDRTPDCAIDGSGMSPVPAMDVRVATAGTATSEAMWLSNGTQDTWIAFDLGEEREITGFHLWNYNEYYGGSTQWQNRGIKTAGVYVGTTMPANGGAYSSAGAAWGTLVQNMTFVRAPSSSTYTGEDYQFNTPVRGRYFQFKVTGNYTGAPPSNYVNNYTGIAEIKFYERVVDEKVTRLASGTKTIADSPEKDVVIEEGTSGAAAPVTLAAGTVRANALRTERNMIYGGVAQVDADGKTLALAEIDIPKGTTALEVLSGTLTCWNSAALWTANLMKWNAEEDLTINASVAANASGAADVLKTGSGALTLGGASSQIGTLRIEDGEFAVTGGMTEAGTLAMESESRLISVGDGATLKVGAFTGDQLDVAINGGTLGTSALGTATPWLNESCKISIGDAGATFDTSGGSAVVDASIIGGTGTIRKMGANTLALTCPVVGTNTVCVEGGTLKLALKESLLSAVNVLDPASDLSIASGATLELDGVDQTVETLTLGGRLMRKGETTWGPIGSGAEHETAQITGTGILRVKGPVKPGFMIIVK